jgi:hypothetical protein
MKKTLASWLAAAAGALLLVNCGYGIGNVVTPTALYTPPVFSFEGTLSTTTPLTESYQLVITSPSTLVSGGTANLVVASTGTPTDAGDATAQGYLTLSSSTVAFTGPNQSVSVLVTLTVPAGTLAGNYSWSIHSSGWPAGAGSVTDGIGGLGATVNANILAAVTPLLAPTATLTEPVSGQVFAITPGNTAATVPYALAANTPAGSVFASTAAATLALKTSGGAAVAGFAPVFNLVSAAGAATGITATGTVNLPAGTYVLSGTATNNTGGSASTLPVTFTVVGPPTLAITAPTAGQVFTIAAGGTAAAVPYTITGTTPAGTTFPASAASATLTLNGAAVSGFAPVFTGAGTGTITGAGTASLAPGVYTLSASATNSSGIVVTATAITFTVNAAPAAPAETLVWLQNCGNAGGCLGNNFGGNYGGGSCGGSGGGAANALQATVTGGSVVPLAFALYTAGGSASGGWGNGGNNQTFVKDTSTLIAIYEVLAGGGSTTPLIYTYGANGPNPPFYSIGSSEYLLYFPTAGGAHHYSVEVYHPGAGGALQLLGTEDLYTQGDSLPAASAVLANFGSTPIAAGNTIWFTSVVNVRGLSGQAATLVVDNATITFSVFGRPVTLAVPAAVIQFDPNATTASTVYNASTQSWVTVVPAGYTGNVFLSGLPYVVPAGFPAGLNSVTWTGSFRSNSSALCASWKWGAAVYTQFTGNLAAITVKPVDAGNLSAIVNSDPAGTPENFKSFLIAGARGTGGSQYLGADTSGATPEIRSTCWSSCGCTGDQDGDRSGDGRDGGNGCGFRN